MKTLRSFKEYHIEKLKNPEYARLHLEIALEEYEKDRDKEAFLLALKDLAEAQGGISKLAEKTKLSRQSLYKVLSSTGNPTLETIENILTALGFRLSVLPLKENDSKNQKPTKKNKKQLVAK
ncbi:MAG: addiction module antidote protein [Planctomycetota bacterium]